MHVHDRVAAERSLHLHCANEVTLEGEKDTTAFKKKEEREIRRREWKRIMKKKRRKAIGGIPFKKRGNEKEKEKKRKGFWQRVLPREVLIDCHAT